MYRITTIVVYLYLIIFSTWFIMHSGVIHGTCWLIIVIKGQIYVDKRKRYTEKIELSLWFMKLYVNAQSDWKMIVWSKYRNANLVGFPIIWIRNVIKNTNDRNCENNYKIIPNITIITVFGYKFLFWYKNLWRYS